MQNLSKYFKQDILSADQNLKPIIRLTNADGVYYFGLDNETIIVDNENINAIPCIQNVSNVKVSTDFDSKRLKINRLRISLFNHYDVKTKLTEYLSTNIISLFVLHKTLFMFLITSIVDNTMFMTIRKSDD